VRRPHELRSILLVIDMHQLTGDPVVPNAAYPPTWQSPDRRRDAVGLPRKSRQKVGPIPPGPQRKPGRKIPQGAGMRGRPAAFRHCPGLRRA
jgi:hypothetical protein